MGQFSVEISGPNGSLLSGNQHASPKKPLAEIIELLRGFLSNPWNVYENGSLAVRKTILKMAFASPLAYDRKNGYRTPQVSVIFDLFENFTAKCEMVRSRRLELPRELPHSDLNAARLPIPPRPHCLGLVWRYVAKRFGEGCLSASKDRVAPRLGGEMKIYPLFSR